jgi:glycolate oxidase FAD binding subunit
MAASMNATTDPATDALAGIAHAVREAASARRPLRFRGGGTKDFLAQSLAGDVLDTRGYAGIVDYDPTELVVTARCGTPLALLDATLRASGQWLACDPPRFGADATVGGMVAAGLAGPRRLAGGSVRDLVLGARMMNAEGEVLTFGGQVMKNVAGYDVSRLLAGSWGTLGLVLEVSLKALPLPPADRTLRFEMPEDKAISQLNQWGGRPLPIVATAWMAGELVVRLSGAQAAVEAAVARLGGEPVADADAFWTGIREHTDPFFRTDLPLWRIAVPTTTPPLGLPGEQAIEWGGGLRWLATQADPRHVRETAERVGGHATLFRNGDRSAGVFHPLAPAIAGLHRRLKATLDPHGIFNPGRMYAGW